MNFTPTGMWGLEINWCRFYQKFGSNLPAKIFSDKKKKSEKTRNTCVEWNEWPGGNGILDTIQLTRYQPGDNFKQL